MELSAVEVPDDALVEPVAVAEINLDTPILPVLVGESDAVTDSVTLVTDTTGVDVTVSSTVAGELAIDGLEDIELTTAGPLDSMADRVTEHPEGRPDALLVARVVCAEADLSLGASQAAALGGEGVLGLDAARGVLAVLVPWYNLESVAAAQLDVVSAGAVVFQLAVDAQVAGDEVPVVAVGRCAAAAGKVVLPDTVEALIAGSLPGRTDGSKGKEGRNKTISNHGDGDDV